MCKKYGKSTRAFLLVLLFLITLSGPFCSNEAYAQSIFKKILIIAPHQDDECIACAGIIKKAVTDGNDVRVLLVTNGDSKDLAETRIKESITALAKLGLYKDKIYYLSYGDSKVLLNAYFSKDNPTKVYNSVPGYMSTYGFSGIIKDYHYLLTGSHASYCRKNILFDIQNVISTYRPDDIYMPSTFETHADHKATALFTMEAVLKIKEDASYSPVIHEYFIYKKGLPQSNLEYNSLPVSYENCDASMDFTSPYNWNDRESIMAPNEMNMAQTLLKGINMVKAGAKYVPDTAINSQNDISKAFDDNINTMYISDGANAKTTVTVTFPSPQLVEKVRAIMGDAVDSAIKTEVTLETAANASDLNLKMNTYRLLTKDKEFTGANWDEIRVGDAYNNLIWRFTLRNKLGGNSVRIPEIEFYYANLKAATIREYTSQLRGFYEKYSMRDEIFWKKQLSSLSYSASVTASSENNGIEQQLCKKVIDGIVLGDGIYKDRVDPYSSDPTRTENANQNGTNREFEWRTLGETTGGWVQLNWQEAITANCIILYDRPDLDENIVRSKLTFSDGSSINVRGLYTNGSSTVIDFLPKTFTWVRLTVEQADGCNVGLAEFEVYKK